MDNFQKVNNCILIFYLFSLLNDKFMFTELYYYYY
jgi:hypothetical protein